MIGTKGTMAMKLAAHHSSFSVSDAERSKAFYGGVLGLPEKQRPPHLNFPGAWYIAGPCEVHLIQTPPGVVVDTPPPELNPMARHMAFAIEDYAEGVAHFRAHGIDVLEAGPERGQFWVQDPDGHILEFIVPRG